MIENTNGNVAESNLTHVTGYNMMQLVMKFFDKYSMDNASYYNGRLAVGLSLFLCVGAIKIYVRFTTTLPKSLQQLIM